MDRKHKLFRILMIVIMIILCWGFTAMEFQNDTFYTIKIGELIINNGIDMMDHFSIHNLAYSYPHWLFDVLVYGIYYLFDFLGIYVFTVLLYCVLVLSIYFVNKRVIKNEFVALLVSFIGLFLLRASVTARAQLVSIILLLYEVYFIERFLENKNKRYVLGLILISLLIVNIHTAVWPFYFVVYLPYVGECFLIWLSESRLVKFLKKKRVRFKINSYNDKVIVEKNSNVKYLLLVMGISLLMGFLTPIGNYAFTYMIRTMMGISQSYIREHQPLILVSNLSFMLLLVVVIGMLIFTKIKIRLRDLFMLAGLTLMTFISVRHILLLVVVGSVAIARVIDDFFVKENDNSISQIIFTLTKGPIMAVVLVMVIGYSISSYNNTNDKGYIDEEVYPVEVSNYILDNLDIDSMRLYNEYNYGSYLMYRGIPVFIDSRADLYLSEFNKGVSIFEDNMNILDDYEAVLNKYEITHVLISKDEALSTILDIDGNYNEIYQDDSFVLYERVGE